MNLPETDRPAFDVVVLDSTAIVADLSLEGIQFRILFAGARRHGLRVAMPAVVHAEVHRHFESKRDEVLERLRSAHRDLKRVVGEVRALPDPELDISRLGRAVDFYEGRIEILPYPSVPHHVLVARDLGMRKPFRADGRGYRDALVWHSVLDLLRETKARIAFVSANTQDFVQNEALHPDLDADLTNGSHEAQRVQWFKSVEQFNDRHIVASLPRVDLMRFDVEQRRFPAFDLHAWLTANLKDRVPAPDLWGVMTEETEGHVVRISNWQTTDVRVHDVRELATPLYSLRATVSARVRAIVHDVSPQAPQLQGQRVDALHAEIGRETSDRALVVEVDLLYDDHAKTVRAVEIRGMGGAHGEIEYELDEDELRDPSIAPS